MFTINDTEATVLKRWGEQLKARRLMRNDRQSDAAARLGVSLATYRKLEAGHPTLPVGYWLRMIRIYGDLDALNEVFTEKKRLFDQLDASESADYTQGRQRARRR
ncbi:hypothetical protein Tel_16980 (plasmid) [Candidatus Tenderia electrophaga]|jgi:transcriptional regulator with XRE-family HTH domain|uniref:HTH cro/C1-type domain-containing protein n=1 Tax=Candidatus Tenderia electrophaga TaxID=1748243 RepID=A0A0S2TIG0_9GAMM|nr:hypothetical protein Tel_16980 [Candidatus Tenderia electrophaga]